METQSEWVAFYQQAGKRMASYYLELYENITPSLDPHRYSIDTKSNQRKAIDILNLELENIREAACLAYKTENWEVLLKLAKSAQEPVGVYVHNYWKGWEEICTLALNAARVTCDKEAEAQALYSIGSVLRMGKKWDGASTYFQESIKLYQEIKDSNGEIRCLLQLGNELRGGRKYTDALNTFSKCVEIASDIGEHQLMAMAVCNIASTYQDVGLFKEAKEKFKIALDIFQKIGDQTDEYITLLELGRLTLDREEGLKYFEDALRIVREGGDLIGELGIMLQFGWFYDERLHLRDEAILTLQRALAIAREIGDKDSEAKAIGGIAILHRMMGKYSDAAEGYEVSANIFENLGNFADLTACLCNFAILYSQLGRFEEALDKLEKALYVTHRLIHGDLVVRESKILFLMSICNFSSGRVGIGIRTFLKAMKQWWLELRPMMQFAMVHSMEAAKMRNAISRSSS